MNCTADYLNIFIFKDYVLMFSELGHVPINYRGLNSFIKKVYVLMFSELRQMPADFRGLNKFIYF
jgi:hypothetical protein